MGISRTGMLAGVEEELLPFEDGKFLGDAGGDDAVEMSVEGGDALGMVTWNS